MVPVIQDKYNKPVYIGDYVLTPLKARGMSDWGEVTVGKVLGKNAHGVEIENVSTRVKTPSRITLVSERFAQLWMSNELHLV
ncbi:hypothetical protein KNT87_gp287 [Erwinia phage Cronus]|uniref:Uncharacterized protein n=1 Tax=Erwinia phage Cronus TaxID=2163633 RepID=A0A2S1GMJ5_9CAUD|nr:hypothetical protein KNT87_gp287 [Erwinia phage Cronus]AWD90573.1 hypothetical protein [Erwinia phage Cronus]